MSTNHALWLGVALGLTCGLSAMPQVRIDVINSANVLSEDAPISFESSTFHAYPAIALIDYDEPVPQNPTDELKTAISPLQPVYAAIPADIWPDTGSMVKSIGYPLNPNTNHDYVLSSREAACSAADNSALANALQLQVASQCNNPRDNHCETSCSREVKNKLLTYRSIYERNKSASQALMLFYTIAEIDQQLALIGPANQQIKLNENRVAMLRNEEIEIPFDATELTRSHIELSNKQEDLSLKRSQANHQLLVLLNSEVAHQDIHPSGLPTNMSTFEIDVDAAVAEGLASRADLGLLNMLENCLNDDTLAAISQALALSTAALGTTNCPPTLRGLIKIACRGPEPIDQKEVAKRRMQIQALAADLSHQIESEIRSAVIEVGTRFRQIRLAERNIQTWNHRIENLSVLRQVEKATSFELTNATLKKITAESDLIHAQSEARIATVKLGSAQGRLAIDCGYSLPTPCCCRQQSSNTNRPRRMASPRRRRR